MNKCVDYLFEVIGEDSDLCGEQFFVEVDYTYEDDPLAVAKDIAAENFPDEELACYGPFSPAYAEMCGLDTY